MLPDGAVGERLGVELHAVRPGASWIDGGWGVSHPRVWRPVLDMLVALGLCVPEKAAALVDFHGRWRVDTAYGACLVGGGLSHLKLVFSGKTVFAKAYPAFGLVGGWLGAGVTSRARRGVRG